MIKEILILTLITLIPALELRASIPYGILKLGMHWLDVFLICIIANMILGIIIYFLLDKAVHLFTKIKWIRKLYDRVVIRAQKKIQPYVEKYGTIGVALFIGVPLPGSGVYTGALGSYIIGLNYRQFIIANIVGVLLAGIAVLLITLFGAGAWGFFIKMV